MKFLTIVFTILFSTFAYAVPAFPMPATTTQPDGTEFALYKRGDEFLSWHEDFKGYTILKNSEDYWVYALKNDLGHLYPSEYIVGKIDPDTLNINKSLKSATLKTRSSELRQRSLAVTRSTPLSGTVKNLVILVDFQDKTHAPWSTKEAFEDLFNKEGYNEEQWYASGSVKDYFKEVSYGALNVESIVVDWVQVSQNYAYYGANDGNGHDIRPREMVSEALQLVEDRGFDFSTIDNDSDGNIDGLTIIHAGGGEEYSGNDPKYLHSHQWWLASPVTYDGVKVQMYHTEPERMGFDNINASKSLTRIGVVCHEMSHFFGLPDLYDRDYSSRGVGAFCIMANGSWNPSSSTMLEADYATKPAHLSAWCKAQLGWINPETISSDGNYSLPQIAENSKAYKIEVPNQPNEYFLIENRQPIGFDESLPGTNQGMLIWHVDEAKSGYQHWNNDESHPLVDLEEASSVQHLTENMNDGDDSDYFRAGNISKFNSTTTPNNQTYSGSFLDERIFNISASQDTMTFSVASFDSIALQGPDSINERSTTNFSYIATYSDSSTQDLSAHATWSTNGSSDASVNSSGQVTTGNLYSSSSFNLSVDFEDSNGGKVVTINDVDPGFTIIDQMLTDEDYVQEAFYEFVNPQVDNMQMGSISTYQAEFERNLDYVNDKNDWYQEIVDEVNAGNNIVINHVTNGWNLISSPFPGWSPNSIDSFVMESVYNFNTDSFIYERQSKNDNFDVSKGYWILYGHDGMANDEAVEFSISGNLAQTPSTSLQIGWNLTGSETDTETLQIGDQGFYWNSETQVYGDSMSEGDKLQLGKAYWIFTTD